MISEIIREKIGNNWVSKTPGFHLQVILNGDTVVDEKFGVTYPNYDWASLTKIVFTHTLFMKCVDEGLLHEDDLVGKFIPELIGNKQLKLRHLLSHTAGLPGTINFWSNSPSQKSDIYKDWRRQVLELNMAPSLRSSYTEIDFQILGYVLESLLGMNLENHWKNLAQPLGLLKTNFRPIGSIQSGIKFIAPTELCSLRGKRIQGEVHHPDVWLNGGIGWLAGLFGPIEDLATWAKGMRSAYYGGDHWIISTSTLNRFTRREVGNSSLGFMMPNISKRDGQKYYLSCGKKFSPISIGHTGFTGPMFWFDPIRDLIVLILANRTFPSSSNEKWFDFRGIIHDEIVSAIEENHLEIKKESTL